MAEPERLPSNVRELIEGRPGDIWFSVASLWEIVIKSGIGKLTGVDPAEVLPAVRDQGWGILEIRSEHVLGIANLPPIHADAFDRLLVSQAAHEKAVLISGDAKLREYPIEVYWSN